MALTDIILQKGEIVVILSNSSLGVAEAGVALNFGIVQNVNDLCDTVAIGDSVWFDITNAVPFMIISGQKFYRVKETDISGVEYIAP